MEAARQSPAQEKETALVKRMDVIEAKIELVMKKLALEPVKPSDVHVKIMDALVEWKSASQLAESFGYSHEHVTRRIAELKRNGRLEERRDGKKILYKRLAK